MAEGYCKLITIQEVSTKAYSRNGVQGYVLA